MPITSVSRPDGSIADVSHPEGASEEDIINFAFEQYQLGLQQEDEDEEGGFFDAIGLGVDVLQQQLGSAVEGIGEATGIDSLTEYGKEVVENNEKEIAENSVGMTSFDELAEDPSLGEAWKFYKEQLGQQVPQLAGSLGVATAGGALAGPLGAVAGAAIGYLPVFYGQHRESQKEAIDRGLRTEMDEGAALLSAIPSASLDFIVDRLLLPFGGAAGAQVAGTLLTRGVKGAAKGVITEVPTEIGQEIIDRYQAGLAIDDEEAIKGYRDVAIAAGLVGGTARGGYDALTGQPKTRDITKEEDAIDPGEFEGLGETLAEADPEEIGFAEETVAFDAITEGERTKQEVKKTKGRLEQTETKEPSLEGRTPKKLTILVNREIDPSTGESIRTYQVVDENLFRYTKPTQDIVKATNDFDALEAQTNLRGALESDREAEKTRDEEEGITPDDDEYGPTILSSEREDELKFHAKQEAIKRSKLKEAIQDGDDKEIRRLGGELSEHTRVIDEINAEIQAAKTPEQIQEEQEAKRQALAEIRGEVAPVTLESRQTVDDEFTRTAGVRAAYRQTEDNRATRNKLVDDLEKIGVGGTYGMSLQEITDSDLKNTSPETRRLIRAFRKEDYYGYDSADELFSQVFDYGIESIDPNPSTGVKSALGRYVNVNYGVDDFAPVTLESKQEDQQIQDTDTYTVVFHRRGKNRDVEDIKSNQNLKQVDKLLEDSMAPEASKQDLLDTGMARIYDYSWGGEEGGEIDIGYIVRNKGTEQIIYGAPTSERDILGKKVLSGEIPEYEYGRKLKLLESREEMRSMLEEMGYGLKTLESRQEDQPVPTEGIHVAKDKKADVSFANLIVSGDKKYETRDQNRTLRRFIGKRIGIIETGDGPAKLVGYATVGQPIEVNEAQFNELRDQHLVPKGSKFDIKEGKTKFLYPMSDPEKLPDPVDVSKIKANRISRKLDPEVLYAKTKKTKAKLTREITDIEKAVEGKTALEAIEYIAKNGKNKSRRIIAKKTAAKIKELEQNGFVFDFQVVHPGSSSTLVEKTDTGGFYKFYPFARKLSEDVAAGKSLLIAGEVKTSEELFRYSEIHVAGADLPRTYLEDDLEDTILHEFVHAVTSRSLDLGRRGKLSEGTEFNILTKDLAQVNNHLVSEYRKRRDAGEFKDYSSTDIFNIEYALSSPHELITMGMTNPATQRFMESVQYKKGTAWSEFIESIRKLLGLPADMDTALNEVSRITEAYIDIPTYRHVEAVQARMEGRKLEQPMAIAALESDREKAENNVSLQTQAVESAIQKDETSQIETAVRQETIADPAINRTEVNTPSTPAASFESPSRNGYQQKWDRFIYQVQDKLLGLKQIEEAINRTRRSMGLEPLTALESPYKGDERIPGIVSGKIKDLEDNEKMPLIREMIEKGVSEKEFNEFLMLRHAMERNEQIRRVNPEKQDAGAGEIRKGIAMTDNFVRGFMKKNYDMEWNRRTGEWKGGNDRAKVLLGLSSKVDAITKKTIDEGRENGLFSEIDAKIFKTFYKYYVPLKGHAIEDEFSSDLQKFGAAGSGGTRSEAGRLVERAKGMGHQALPPLGSIFHDREMMIVRGVKNKEVGINLVNLIKKHPAEDTWELIDPKNPKYQAYFDSFYTYIGDDPIDGKYGERATDISDKIDKKNWVKRISQKQVPQQSRGSLFGAKVDGEQFFIEFKDKDLERALLNLDAGSSTRIIQMLGSFNRYLSFMNTSLNPEFMLGNFPRDLQTALANLHAEKKMEGGAAPVKASITRIVKNSPGSVRKFYRGIRGSTLSKEDQSNFDEYIRSGAKTDWFHSRNPEEQIADIKNLISMNNGSFTGSAKRRFKSTINFVDDVNSAVENGVRFATFVEARDRFIQEGVDRPEAVARAASLAKNLTVNFNRKGMSGDTMNALYLFYNASVQGTANLMRGIGSKKKLMSAMIGMGYLTSMLADEMSDEDEYREGLKDFQKTRNMLIPKSLIFGDKAEGDQFVMIPLPYGYNVFHVIGMAIYDMQKGYISEPKAAALVTKTFMGSFSPIGTSESDDGITAFAKTFTPTVGTPVVDYLSNQNFFGAPVRATNFPSYNAPKLPQSSLKLNSTPEALRRFTETLYEFTGGDEKGNKGFFTLDVSPDVLNHMVDFTTGAAGATAMRAVGTVERAAEGEFDINQTPFLRKYLAEGDDFNDRNIYFERRQKLINTDDYFRNETKGAERGQYFRDNKEYIGLNRQRKRIDKLIGNLKKRLRRVRARAEEDLVFATRVAPQEEERIEDEIQKLMSDFNDLYDEKIGIDK
mgnify:CR=1 FL=1